MHLEERDLVLGPVSVFAFTQVAEPTTTGKSAMNQLLRKVDYTWLSWRRRWWFVYGGKWTTQRLVGPVLT